MNTRAGHPRRSSVKTGQTLRRDRCRRALLQGGRGATRRQCQIACKTVPKRAQLYTGCPAAQTVHTPGTRRIGANPAWFAGSTNENAQPRGVGRKFWWGSSLLQKTALPHRRGHVRRDYIRIRKSEESSRPPAHFLPSLPPRRFDFIDTSSLQSIPAGRRHMGLDVRLSDGARPAVNDQSAIIADSPLYLSLRNIYALNG